MEVLNCWTFCCKDGFIIIYIYIQGHDSWDMKEFCAECLTSLPCYVLPSWKTANTPLAFPNLVLNVFQFKPENSML